MERIDFQLYKNKILIRDAALMAGYAFVPGKNSNGSTVMSCGHDKIIIMRPLDIMHNRYFNPGNDNDHGDLLEFILNRLDIFRCQVHWDESNHTKTFNPAALSAILPWLAGHSQPVTAYNKSAGDTSTEQRSFTLSNYDICPLNADGLAFLKNSRHISESTILKFSPYIRSCLNLKNEKFRTYNIAFPYQIPGTDNVCNFELRNYKYKGHAEGGNKSTASWVADFSGSHLLTQDVFLFESSIDAMSYAELFESKINFNLAAFVSLGGSIAIGQIIRLRDHFPNARFHGCFDNDLQGHMYDIKVACILEGRTLRKIETPATVRYNLDGKEFEIPKTELTYTRFKKESGCVRLALNIHKPKPLVDVIHPQTGKKATVTFKDYNECLSFIKLHTHRKPLKYA